MGPLSKLWEKIENVNTAYADNAPVNGHGSGVT